MIKFVITFVLLVACFAHAEDSTVEAAQRLTHVAVFAFGGIGFAGRISEGQRDFMIIMAQPSDIADAALRRVLREGNVEGKSYAVVGLTILHPEESEALLAQLRAAGDVVFTQRGCIVEHERMVDIIARLPAYRLQDAVDVQLR